MSRGLGQGKRRKEMALVTTQCHTLLHPRFVEVYQALCSRNLMETLGQGMRDVIYSIKYFP